MALLTPPSDPEYFVRLPTFFRKDFPLRCNHWIFPSFGIVYFYYKSHIETSLDFFVFLLSKLLDHGEELNKIEFIALKKYKDFMVF